MGEDLCVCIYAKRSAFFIFKDQCPLSLYFIFENLSTTGHKDWLLLKVDENRLIISLAVA